jgi:Derlin-2/3
LNVADYAFYLSIVMPLIVFVSVITQSFALLENFLGAITFTWSRANKNQRVNFYFMTIEAKHLPIVTLGFKLLLEGPRGFFAVLFGMAAAYFYSCIESRSLGPLYSYIVDTLGINVIKHSNTNRVGTIHTMYEVQDGYLPAPAWFRSIVHNLIGHPRPDKKNGQFGKAAESTAAKTSGFSYRGSFQGKGHRLGG